MSRPLPVVDVAVSVVRAADGRVLMAERTATQISPGFWELPGGKIDPGETAAQAAARELDEEVGIRAGRLRPLVSYEHAFRTRRVRLQFFGVDSWSGTPRGREGQRIAWVAPEQPEVGPILPSAERVLLALGLPPVYAVAEDGLAAVQRALEGGARLIQFRAPRLAPDQRVAQARRAAALAGAHGARLLLAGSALEARRAGLSGLHSTSRDLHRLTGRPAVKLWICSCHDGDELRLAVARGADAAVLSPVLRSASHPELQAIGWEGLKTLAAESPIPVYAQGGMSPAALARARETGAAGVAFAMGSTC
jgi:8-oxo-dGTP diphosphatase